MNKLLIELFGFGAVLGAGAVFLQHETNAELRDEIAALRTDMQQLAQQRQQAAREAGKAVVVAETGEAAQKEAERTELAKLRDEVAALKKSTQETARVAQAAQQAAKGESPIPVKLIPASEWKNAGRATASAAVETLLWAAVGGDVETMANSIALEPAARAKAEELLARLPETTRAEYGSADKLVALFLAKDAAAVSGMQILGQRDITPDVVGVRVRVANEQGQTKEESFGFRRAADGLRLVIPENVVDKYSRQITGAPPAPAGGGK